MDSRRAPQWIRCHHLSYEQSDFGGHSWSSRSFPLGQLPPVSLEASPLPADHGLRSHDYDGGFPIRLDPSQSHPKNSIPLEQSGSPHVSSQDGQLMPQCQILQSDLLVTAKNQKGQPQSHQKCFQHSWALCRHLAGKSNGYLTDGFWRSTGLWRRLRAGNGSHGAEVPRRGPGGGDSRVLNVAEWCRGPTLRNCYGKAVTTQNNPSVAGSSLVN